MRSVRQPVPITPAAEVEAAGPLLEAKPGYQPQTRPWTEIHVLPDGQTLEVSGVHGNGGQLHSLEVDESDPAVVLVTMWVALEKPPKTGFMTLIGHPFRARVRLQRPLGTRVAMDGSLGTEEQVRAAELESAVRWRAEMGLPTDRALVTELVHQARMPDGRLYGQEVMSDDEDRWYQRALDDKEAAANFAKSWLADQPADLDGHAEITWFAGGDYVQYVTGDADGLRAAASAAGIRRLRVQTVAFTYRELDRFHTEIREMLAAQGIRVVRSGPDVRANGVALTVVGDESLASQCRVWATEIAPPEAFSVVALS